MPVPPQFNNGTPRLDFMTWFNSIVGTLAEQNGETFHLLKFWPSLTTAQKSAIKSQFVTDITARKADLDAISSYVATEI